MNFNVKMFDPSNMEKARITGVTDRDMIGYSVGEDMIFDFTVKSGDEIVGVPQFSWSVERDFHEKYSGISDGKSGKLQLKTSMDKPGYVRVIVNAVDENGNGIPEVYRFDGGACAGFDSLKPAVEEPDDFDSFWAEKMAKLSEIEPVLLEYKKEDMPERDDYDTYSVKVEAGEWGPTTGYIIVPKTAEKGKMKIKMVYMGYGVGTANWWGHPDYITFSVNAHAIENNMPREYYDDLLNNVYKKYGLEDERNNDREKAYFLQMIMRDVQAVKFIMKSDYWNGKDIDVFGMSQGGFQCIAVTSLMCDYVTSAIAEVPWMCDIGGIEFGRMAGPGPKYEQALDYFNSTNFARRIKCPIDIETVTGEYVSPVCFVSVMYNQLKCPRRFRIVQNRDHGTKPKDISVSERSVDFYVKKVELK
ncbi:MAG: acetylxylan esterase [Clostridia bacterium]|nr:acetylxylan esterase [Clostridia bacterium]